MGERYEPFTAKELADLCAVFTAQGYIAVCLPAYGHPEESKGLCREVPAGRIIENLRRLAKKPASDGSRSTEEG